MTRKNFGAVVSPNTLFGYFGTGILILTGSALGDDLILCYEQPRRIEEPLMVPANSSSTGTQAVDHSSSWISSGYNLVAKASSRVSFSSSTRPTTLFSRSSPSISEPTGNHRGNETANRKRKSFRPLELTIYLPNNRLSPLPNFNASDWDRKPAELEYPAQALIRPRVDSIHSEPLATFVFPHLHWKTWKQLRRYH